ncbi:MAG: hypothetical protein WA895_26100 [Streptosporangiaceae bacterium]
MGAVAVNLGPLVRADGILDGEGMKAELLGDDLQVSLGGLVEVQPRDGALVGGEALGERFGGEALVEQLAALVEAGAGGTLRGDCRGDAPRGLPGSVRIAGRRFPARAPSARSWPSRVPPARRRGTAPARELSPPGAQVQELPQAIGHDPPPLLLESGGELLAEGGGQAVGFAAGGRHVGAGWQNFTWALARRRGDCARVRRLRWR